VSRVTYHVGKVQVAVFMVLVACGGDTTAPAREAVLTLGGVVGTWVMDVQGNSSCIGAAGDSQRFITLTSDQDPTTTREAVNFVDKWEVVDPPRFDWPVTGNIDLRTGALELRLWLRLLEVGSLLTGTVDLQSNFTGTLRDPIPGFSPHFVLGSCAFQVTGSRR